MINTRRNWKRCGCLVAAAAMLGHPVDLSLAQDPGMVPTAAQNAVARRQELIAKADEAAMRGQRLLADKDYAGAAGELKKALDLLPDAPISEARRAEYTRQYADAMVNLARQRAEEGRLPEAIELVTEVLSPDVDPENQEARILFEDLNDPEMYNPSITPEFIAKVKQVDQALKRAQSFIRVGDYDSADKTYNEVLNYDPYNSAARRGLEEVSKFRRTYYDTAYDQTRAKALTDISALWESPVVKFGLEANPGGPVLIPGDDDIQVTNEKLKRIIIPEIEFENTPLESAVEFLRQKSVDLDNMEADPLKKGVNIVIRAGSGGGGAAPAPAMGGGPIFDDAAAGGGAAGGFGGGDDVRNRPITLKLSNVTLGEALRYTTEMARLKYKVEPSAVVIIPMTEMTDDLVTRTFRVPPALFNTNAGDGGGGAAAGDPFAAIGGGGGGAPGGLTPIKSPKQILEENGISFPPGSSVIYSKQTSQLIVRNTSSQMELIEAFIQGGFEGVEKQVYITTKFVEIRQDDDETFGFDWLMGQSNVPGSNRAFMSGGTTGSTRNELNNLDFPFIPPGGGQPTGNFPVTSALRSGTLAASQNSIDALLSGTVQGQTNLAPAVLALAGVFTDPEFQVVLRAISQHKGTDLLSAPSIVTRSGNRAKIEVIREFIYPSEYDPPEIPQEFDSLSTTGLLGGGGLGATSVSSFPVTPANPAAFETRNVGVTMEVDPQIGPDGFTISLNLSPEVVEFEGFVNYGSPIFTGGVANGQPVQIQLTENRIEMPIFATRRVSTAVDIWDGQTVAIGGLIREDVQHVEDKVPILGDIPIAGFFFRSESDVHIKRNLTVFVTATLIDPSGQPVNQPGGGAVVQ